MSGKARAEPVWADLVEWPAVEQQAIEWLRAYVAFRTVNDPAATASGTGELDACEWLAGLLRAEGLECELLESAHGRANLVAQTGAGAATSSITLLSHSDIVPAVSSDWDVDPFAGQVRDGYLYGRGVLDLKGLGIAQVMTLILLHRLRVPLRRQVRLLVLADEEAGGIFGAEWLLRTRPALLDTSLVLGEGAYSVTGVLPAGKTLHAIAVAEKGYLELELIARGAAAHSSIPALDSAPARLVLALARISGQRPQVRLTAATQALCASLAEGASGVHRYILRHPRLVERIGPRALHLNPIVASMLTETPTLTILDSGYKSNVIPGQARAVLNIRLLPETDPDAVFRRISQAAADPQIEIKRVAHKTPTSSSFETDDYRALALLLGSSGQVTPILSPGASDARFWRTAGVPAYGWIPFVVPVADIHGVHGANERVSLAAFRAGIRQYYQAIVELASASE